MRSTFRLGRYAGIPVGAHWSVLVTVFLLADLLAVSILPTAAPGVGRAGYWVTALTVSVVFMLSLLAHELAHAVLGRRFGVRVKDITLWMLGGATMFEDEPPTPRADALIAGIGPAVSAVLGVGFLGLAWLLDPAWLSGLPVTGLGWLAIVNLLLAGFNLLPAAPLDGGRLLRAAVWRKTGDRQRAASTAGTAGQVTGAVLVAAGGLQLLVYGQLGGLWLALVGWFVMSSAAGERTQALIAGELGGTRVGDVATPHPVVAAGWLTVEAFLDHLVEHNVRYRLFPVVDFGGAPVGVISLRDLATVPTDARRGTRVQDVARPLDHRTLALAGEPVSDLLGRAPLRAGYDAVVVLHDRRIAGIVTAADLARTLELARLGRRLTASSSALGGSTG